MAVDLVELRVAAALVHALPTAAAELRLGGRCQTIHVGRSTTAVPALSPCKLRQQLLARLREHPCAPAWMDRVTQVMISGNDIENVGADLFRTTVHERKVDCFATLLHPDLVVDVLTEVSSRRVGDGDRTAVLLPDRGLAVTVVMLDRPQTLSNDRSLSSARDAQAACLVAEVTRALTIESPATGE